MVAHVDQPVKQDEDHVRSSKNASFSSDGQTLNEDVDSNEGSPQRSFRTYRVRKQDVRAPWLLKESFAQEEWGFLLPFMFSLLGIVAGGLLAWNGWSHGDFHDYCLVYEDDFSRGLDPDIWQTEIQLGGFGFVPLSFLILS